MLSYGVTIYHSAANLYSWRARVKYEVFYQLYYLQLPTLSKPNNYITIVITYRPKKCITVTLLATLAG